MVAEARLLRQHKGRLEARMQILEDHNRQLEAQLQRLRQLLDEVSLTKLVAIIYLFYQIAIRIQVLTLLKKVKWDHQLILNLIANKNLI